MRAMSFRFIGGLTEDYNLGNSLSESSGELFQRVKGEDQYISGFGEEVHAAKHTSW